MLPGAYGRLGSVVADMLRAAADAGAGKSSPWRSRGF
jgi:hypothetical protein